jgi:hypothetical protein
VKGQYAEILRLVLVRKKLSYKVRLADGREDLIASALIDHSRTKNPYGILASASDQRNAGDVGPVYYAVPKITSAVEKSPRYEAGDAPLPTASVLTFLLGWNVAKFTSKKPGRSGYKVFCLYGEDDAAQWHILRGKSLTDIMGLNAIELKKIQTAFAIGPEATKSVLSTWKKDQPRLQKQILAAIRLQRIKDEDEAWEKKHKKRVEPKTESRAESEAVVVPKAKPKPKPKAKPKAPPFDFNIDLLLSKLQQVNTDFKSLFDVEQYKYITTNGLSLLTEQQMQRLQEKYSALRISMDTFINEWNTSEIQGKLTK